MQQEQENVAEADRLPRPRTVVLTIPADREQVVLVRSVAGHIGARLGLSVAELTDLRLAVDGEMVECRFEESAAALAVTMSAPTPPTAEPDVENIGWLMLSALVDELTWKAEHGVARVTLIKHLTVRGS
jgi:serine/threonine-protein kinase RsbW